MQQQKQITKKIVLDESKQLRMNVYVYLYVCIGRQVNFSLPEFVNKLKKKEITVK